jgi:hypothetical protein
MIATAVRQHTPVRMERLDDQSYWLYDFNTND